MAFSVGVNVLTARSAGSAVYFSHRNHSFHDETVEMTKHRQFLRSFYTQPEPFVSLNLKNNPLFLYDGLMAGLFTPQSAFRLGRLFVSSIYADS